MLTVPGRQEALAQLRRGGFDLALIDAVTELYDAPTFAAELRAKAKGELMIAVLVEPRHRPPRHRMTGPTKDVIVLQEGSVDHMIRLLHLAVSVRAEPANLEV